MTTMSWTSEPTAIWLGTTGLIGYSAKTGARTSDYFEGHVRAKVTRRASGGAYEFGCVPLLKKDCGTKTVTFQDIGSQVYINTGEDLARYRLRPVAEPKPPSPFRACGLLEGGEPIDSSPDFGTFVLAEKPWRPGVVGTLDDVASHSLLATRVGATIRFRGNSQAVDVPNDFEHTTGKWTGTLTFRRIK